ncbi:MAG: TonB-dependent receptor plug domain-containing protein, partial [Rubrivivax sp.]|nr:TonB-dependent receptor plug domain-containing protein [Rubrivivax sp.]
MASTTTTFRFAGIAMATAMVCCSPVSAQDTVTITGRSTGTAGLAGFGNTPLARAPLQASVIGQGLLADQGILQISGLTRLDASVGDAYNAEGYWSVLSVRGYTLDNRFNVRRDGLPINAETAIALDNKDRLELIKGTSGIQAGTSAPGGLLNLVVKRPNGNLRQARLEWRERGSVLGAVDLGQRFGNDGAVAVRLNAAYEKLDPQVRNTKGERSLAALAADWQLSPDTLLQAELESSRQRQPSVAGYSLLGNSVPSAKSIDPGRNLNDQPWRQDVKLDGDTASLRWQQRLSGNWRFTAHAMQQRLHSDDRTAFPFGVYDASYDCPDWCDRYAPDGSFTYWEYISDQERRTSSAL